MIIRVIIKYICLLNFISVLASATTDLHATNGNKFNYSHSKRDASINNIKQINAAKYYMAEHKNTSYLVKQVQIKVKGVEFQGKLGFISQQYLGKYIDGQDILNINTQLTEYFIDQDYLLPQISINEKDLDNGVVNITVQIASLSDVIIIGENNDLLQAYARKILEDRPTRVKKTQRYLALMNKIPGYDVRYKMREDVQNDLIKVDLIVATKRLKGEVFANIDNYGVNSLGKDQALTDAQIFSPFGDSDSLGISGFTTNHPGRLYDVGAIYSVPVNNLGTRAYFSASYSQDNPTRSNGVNAQNSHQNNFSLMATHPLYLTASQDLEIEFGAHFKSLTNYGWVNPNTNAESEYSKYWSANTGLEYLFQDNLAGHNLIKANFIQGLNGSFQNYQDPGNTASKHFNLVSLNLYRDQPLANNFSIFAHLAANYSNRNLPDQELFILGGRDFGRGYPFCTIDGNKMLAFALEVRYSKALSHKVIEQLQPYVFFDTGHIGQQASNTNIANLTSAGSGLRMKFSNNVDFSIEVAQPFKRSYTVDGVPATADTRFNMFLNKIFKF